MHFDCRDGLAGIREALARLALEGLVVRRARVGTSVAPLESTKVGSTVDRLAAPDMHASHPQDGSQYDFIRENGRSEHRSDKQAL